MISLEPTLDYLLVTSLCELRLHSHLSQEEIHHGGFLEWSLPVALVNMHVSDDSCVVNELDVTSFKPAFHYLIADHLHSHLRFLPQSVHDLEKLQR